VFAEHIALSRELFGGAADEVPVLGESGRSAQRAFLAVSSDAIGGCGRWIGLGLQRAFAARSRSR